MRNEPMKKMDRKLDLTNKKIVIIYMLYFGDMVSLSPFLHVLRRAAKGSEISLVIDSRFQESVAYNPNVDHIIPVDRKATGMIGTWKLGRTMEKEKPDILMVLHGTTRTTCMALSMRPGFWTGEMGTKLDRFLMDQPLLVERKNCHAADKYVRILQDLGIQDVSYEGMELFTCPSWESAAENFFQFHHISKMDIQTGKKKLVGFSVGSSTKEKNWPAERFGQVADILAEMGYIPMFFGVSSEKPMIEKSLSVMKHAEKAIVAAGAFSMGEFMAAASWCRAAFTNDSGPMYVFDSRGVPTIALFGPSNARLHHPLGKRSCALASTDMPMEQDHVRHTIRDKSYIPISRIPVESVIRAGKWALGLQDSDLYRNHYVVIK